MQVYWVAALVLGACGSAAKAPDEPPKTPSRQWLAVTLRNQASFAVDSVALAIDGVRVSLDSINLRFAGVPRGASVSAKVLIKPGRGVVCLVKLYGKGALLLTDAYVARHRTYVPNALALAVRDRTGPATVTVRDNRGYVYRPILEK